MKALDYFLNYLYIKRQVRENIVCFSECFEVEMRNKLARHYEITLYSIKLCGATVLQCQCCYFLNRST